MAADLTALEAAITQIEGVARSTEELLIRLAGLYAACKNDPAAVQALSDRVVATATAMAAAVVANDPGEGA